MRTPKFYIATVIILLGLFTTIPASAKVAPAQYGEDQSIMSLSTQSATFGPTYGNSSIDPSSPLPSHALSASSQNLNAGGVPNGGVGNGNGNGNQSHLPINDGIVFLLIAGIAIGAKTLFNNSPKPAYP